MAIKLLEILPRDEVLRMMKQIFTEYEEIDENTNDIEQISFAASVMEPGDDPYPSLWADWEISHEPICYEIPADSGDKKWEDADGDSKYDYMVCFFYALPEKCCTLHGFRIRDGKYEHMSCWAS